MREESMSLDSLSQVLHIQRRQLQALLSDQYALLPDGYYVRHLARLVTTSLHGNLDYAEKLLPEIDSSAPEKAFDRKRVRQSSLLSIARLASGLGVAAVFLGLLAYFGFNMSRALLPPQISVLNPASDLVTDNRNLVLQGQTEPEVVVKVNGQVASVDDAGVFQAPLFLDDGLNVIEVRANRRYSKENVIYRRVMVERPKVEELGRR